MTKNKVELEPMQSKTHLLASVETQPITIKQTDLTSTKPRKSKS